MSDTRLYMSVHRIESSTLSQEGFEDLYREEKQEGITIFIPNWNHRTFLPRSLRSALDALEHLENKGLRGEILVIDDASRDGSQKLLRTIQALYDEPRFKILCLQQNLGLTRLRNLALRMCRYRHMCMMDADNELVPSNLPLFLRSIRETGATLVHGNLVIRQHGAPVSAVSNMVAPLGPTEANYIGAFVVVDVEKILRIGGYARLHPYTPDDWEMFLHLIAEEEKIVFVPAVLGYYYKQTLSANEENQPYTEDARRILRRVYTQTGTREWDGMKVGRMYHPDVGYIV